MKTICSGSGINIAAIAMLDENGFILEANDRFKRLFMYTHEELQKMQYLHLIAERFVTKVETVFKVIKDVKSAVMEIHCLNRIMENMKTYFAIEYIEAKNTILLLVIEKMSNIEHKKFASYFSELNYKTNYILSYINKDEVNNQVAHQLAQNMRLKKLIAKYSGDEYVESELQNDHDHVVNELDFFSAQYSSFDIRQEYVDISTTTKLLSKALKSIEEVYRAKIQIESSYIISEPDVLNEDSKIPSFQKICLIYSLFI